MATPAQIRAVVKYNKSRGSIQLRPTKEENSKIRAYAAAAGQPLQTYILQAVRERMERESAETE